MSRQRRITLLIIFALIFHSGSLYAHQERLINRARLHLGRGEAGSNNTGHWVRVYLRGEEGLAWCAGFISYILQEENITCLGYSLSAKELFNRARAKNLIAEEAKAGDLIVFWRGSPGSWLGHIGIVTEITKTKIITIEGNRGPYPAKVSYFEYDKENIPKLLGFIRLGGER